ncbi:MAG: DUF1963 domain-containing protein [Oleispira sp.]
MSNNKLDILLRPLIKEGLKLTPVADGSAVSANCKSKFGGLPYAEAGDCWPSCPTCKKELTFINQIFDEKEDTLFVFFYCNECGPWGLGDEEKGQWIARQYKKPSIENISEIQRKNKDKFPITACSVSTASAMILPDWEGIDSVSEEVSDLCCEIDNDSPWEVYEESVVRAKCLNDYSTILGGYPRYVQGEVSATCIKCNSEMEFYAQIDSEDEAELMWGDVGLVYFYRCSEHKDEIHLELQCH